MLFKHRMEAFLFSDELNKFFVFIVFTVLLMSSDVGGCAATPGPVCETCVNQDALLNNVVTHDPAVSEIPVITESTDLNGCPIFEVVCTFKQNSNVNDRVLTYLSGNTVLGTDAVVGGGTEIRAVISCKVGDTYSASTVPQQGPARDVTQIRCGPQP